MTVAVTHHISHKSFENTEEETQQLLLICLLKRMCKHICGGMEEKSDNQSLFLLFFHK